MLSDLQVGLQVTHHGVPMELLYLKWRGRGVQAWMVRPLFVVERDREERFTEGEKITKLHAKVMRAG